MDGGGKKVDKRTRTERRTQASPYARSAAPAPPSTSRFGSLLSGILSPFRSTRKPAPLAVAEVVAREQENIQHDAELDAAPPSPTPLNRRLYPNLSLLDPPPLLEPSSTNYHLLQSTPNQSRTAPQRNRDSYLPFGSSGEVEPSPPRVANDVLAEFFKAQGDKPLSELEQAGVMQLLQQSTLKSDVSNLPTVFTPNFKRQSRSGPNSTPLPSLFSPGQSAIPISTPRFASSSTSTNTNIESPYRRRRPIYVGAGQSAARRQRTTSNLLSGSTVRSSMSTNDLVGLSRGDTEMGEMGMGRSSSEGMLASLAEGAEGKRRKLSEESALRRTKEVVEKEVVGDVEMGENEEGVVDGANGVSGSGKGVGRDVATAVGTTGSIARPSPLWQSSKAATPSPSPPKKVVATASTPKVATGTAGLVLNVIQQIDAVTPKISRQAVLNPYESTDSPISRIPRSRPARPNTPRASGTPRRAVVAPTPVKEVEISPLEKLERSMPVAYQRDNKATSTPSAIPRPSASSALPPPFVFGAPTQPPESSSFPTSFSSSSTTTKKLPVPQPTILKKPTPKLPSSKLKQVEVIELSSSDDEEEEQEIPLVRKGKMRVQEVQKEEVDEDEGEEDEEMDELDEDVDGEEEEEMVLPPIIVRRPIANLSSSKIPSPTKSRIPQRSSTAPKTTTTALGGPIVASGFSFTAPSVFSPPKDEGEVVEEKVVSRSHIRLPKNPAPVSAFASAPISKSFSASAPKIGTTITSSTQTKLSTPSFSFTAPPPPPIVPSSIEAVDELAAKESAKLVDVAGLPKFSFDLLRAQSGKGMGIGMGEEVDQVEKGVMDLVREMSRKELPIIRL